MTPGNASGYTAYRDQTTYLRRPWKTRTADVDNLILIQYALQVDVSFITVSSHESKNTPTSHLNKFYQKFSEVRDKKFD